MVDFVFSSSSSRHGRHTTTTAEFTSGERPVVVTQFEFGRLGAGPGPGTGPRTLPTHRGLASRGILQCRAGYLQFQFRLESLADESGPGVGILGGGGDSGSHECHFLQHLLVGAGPSGTVPRRGSLTPTNASQQCPRTTRPGLVQYRIAGVCRGHDYHKGRQQQQ